MNACRILLDIVIEIFNIRITYKENYYVFQNYLK